jgi:hypothetical protein
VTASRAFRAAIEARREQGKRTSPFRLKPHSVCDFCFRLPVWYYNAPEIFAMRDGTFALERDTPDTTNAVHRFDTGWFACDECKQTIEDRNVNGLLLRWSRASAEIPGAAVANAATQVVALWELLLQHISAPVKITDD